MATLPANDFDEEQGEAPEVTEEGLTLQDILSGQNLAEVLDEAELSRIGQLVINEYELDKASRADTEQGEGWEARYERNMKVAMQVKEDKVFPWAGCYTLDHDVLTADGWRPVGDVRIGDMLYTRDKTGRAFYAPAIAEFTGETEKLIHFKGKSVDLLVTPNHNMVVADKDGSVTFRSAQSLHDQRPTNRYIPLTSRWEGKRPDTMHGIPTRSYVRMLGWYLSEGWACFGSTNKDGARAPSSFCVSQCPAANPEKRELLERDIAESGVTYKPSAGATIILHAQSMADTMKREWRALGTQIDRYIPHDVKQLAPEYLEELLDTLVLGDGCTKPNGSRDYYTISRRLADDIQEIAQKAGIRARVTNDGKRNGMIDGREIVAKHDIYRVALNTKPRCQYQKIDIQEVECAPTAYACVEVETHMLYVRRNGIACWSGNSSNSKSPILTIAAIQFNAEAYPVIVDGSNLVKGRVLGPDPNGDKRARADRIGQHMTWQLLYRMPGWEAETDRLLLILPIVGCMFRKTYYDSIENANCSDIVSGLDFVIDNDAKSIESAPRYTQVLHLYPYEVQGLVNAGLWLDVPRDDENNSEDDEALGDYYEQHRCLDLDDDGFPEHYVVTCTKEGKVARIVPCFGPEDITIRRLDTGATAKLQDVLEEIQQFPIEPQAALQMALQVAGPVVKIERRQYFTKYGFIPSPDGSFYDIGFGDLLDNVTGLIDRLHNQILDAATLANAQGGFIGSGVNVRGGNFAFRTVGEWKRVDAGGQDLRSQIVPLALPGPSPVSLSLLEMLYQQARDITAAQDVVAGRAPANQPATTTLALIEQAGQVRKGIFKRIWRAFGAELRILRRLNRDYLDEEEYFNLNDPEPQMGEDGQPAMDDQGQPQMTTTAKVGREDYQDADLDVIPVADPSQISDTHRMARAQAAYEMFNGNPLVNQEWLIKRMLEALGATDTKEAMKVPQPPPPPEVMKIVGQLANDKTKAESDARRADADASQKNMAAAVDAASIGLLEDASILAAKAVGQEEMNEPEQPGGIPGMAGPPADQGVPELAGGQPPQLDPSMGPGLPDDGGGAGAGGDAGGLGETPLQ